MSLIGGLPGDCASYLDPFSGHGGACLDLPRAIPDLHQFQTVRDLAGLRGGQQVLSRAVRGHLSRRISSPVCLRR